MRTKFLICMFTCMFVNTLYSQTPSENLNKYWHYRDRLKSKFLVSTNQWKMEFGRNRGINIPASCYNPTNIEGDANETALSVKWGDATCDLGYYIAVLATEYKLLQNSGQNVIPTLTELFYALLAIERLDWHAEGLYGCGNCLEGYTYDNTFIYFPYTSAYGACLNGFFIRDDVPDDFTDYWTGKGYTNFKGLKVHSDFQTPSDAAESQDQVWNLLLGLSLVKKLVDYSGNMTDGDGEAVTFVKCAQKITNRLVSNFIHSDGTWSVINPCTKKVTDRGGSVADLYPNAYYFAEAANWITDKQWGDYHKGINPHDILPLPYGFPFTTPKFYNDNAKLTLSTIAGIDWSSSYNNTIKWISSCSVYYNGLNIKDNKNDVLRFAFEHYPLMNIILHDLSPSHYYYHYFMNFVENILNLAPYDGPFCYIKDVNGDNVYDKNDYPVREWATHDRIRKPIGIDIAAGSEAGEYNGLDYMLLHNLYRLVYYSNLNIDKQISESFPYGYGKDTVGDKRNTTQTMINSLQNISATNIINSNANVVYRGGHSVKLQPGFQVKSGGVFRACIDPHVGLTYKKTSQLKNGLISIDETQSSFNVDFLVKNNAFINNAKSLKVYPNPTSGVVNISNECDEDYVLNVYNQIGAIVKHEDKIQKEKVIDISQQPVGIYMFELISRKETNQIKIVKN
jgi:hypothetical protein